MKLGLQIPSFSWPDAPGSIGPTLARIASCADEGLNIDLLYTTGDGRLVLSGEDVPGIQSALG